jgi:hypothetical protein
MLIRIVDSQLLNADTAERFSFGQTTRGDVTEPLWYFGIHWMNEGGTVIALKDQSPEGGKAILDFIMAAGEADKKCVDLSPFLLTREEEDDLIRELQSVKRRTKAGDVAETELVN